MQTNDRDFCPRCAIKHLGKAKILMDEARLGYPYHVWLALANMSEAEDELLRWMPQMAIDIREHRVLVEKSLAAGCALHVPDFKSLMESVAEEAMLEELFVDSEDAKG